MTFYIFWENSLKKENYQIHSNMTAYVIDYNGGVHKHYNQYGNASKASMVVLLMIYCNSLVIQTQDL